MLTPPPKKTAEEELIALLNNTEVLNTLRNCPTVFEDFAKFVAAFKKPPSKALRSAFLNFLTEVKKVFADNGSYVPQQYAIICPKNNDKEFIGTAGVGPCVVCIVTGADKLVFSHCDERNIKEAIEKTYAEDVTRRVGKNSTVTLVFRSDNKDGVALAKKLQLAFQNVGTQPVTLVPRNMDGCILVLKTGQIVIADILTKWISPTNKLKIESTLRLSSDSHLYHIDDTGTLVLQTSKENYNLKDAIMIPQNASQNEINADLKLAEQQLQGAQKVVFSAASSSSSATAAAGTSKQDEKTGVHKQIASTSPVGTSPTMPVAPQLSSSLSSSSSGPSLSSSSTSVSSSSSSVSPISSSSLSSSLSLAISALSNSSQSGYTVSVNAATGLVASSSSSLPQYNSSTSNSSTLSAISSSTTPNVSASTAETPESTQNPPKNPNHPKL